MEKASGKDVNRPILQEMLEYIREDEYVEVTPKSMRMRKIILDHTERKRANRD